MSDPRDPPEGGDDLDAGYIDDEGGGPDPELDEDGDPEPGGDEPEDEPGDPQDEPQRGETQQRPGRKTQAQRLRERIERQDAEHQVLKQQLQTLTQQRQQPAYDPAAAARAQQEENERVALMGPAEAAQYYYQKGQNEFRQAMLGQQLQTQDLIDRQAYDAAARTSRVHRDYRQRVEDLLSGERARGNLAANRTALLAYLVGNDAIERAGKAAPQQRRQANARVAGQQVRPASARGDGARGGRTTPDDADERLLRGVRAGDI